MRPDAGIGELPRQAGSLQILNSGSPPKQAGPSRSVQQGSTVRSASQELSAQRVSTSFSSRWLAVTTQLGLPTSVEVGVPDRQRGS